MRKIISLLLALCLVVGMVPLAASAEDATIDSFNALDQAIQGNSSEIKISGSITFTSDLIIPSGKTVTITGSEGSSLNPTGENSLVVKGNLILNNVDVRGDMAVGHAPVTISEDGASFKAEGVTIENLCTSGRDSFSGSAQGIQVAKDEATFGEGVSNATVSLINSTIRVNAPSARGIATAGTGAGVAQGIRITLDNSKIYNGNNPTQEWKGGYSRGLDLSNAMKMIVEIENGSEIAGFQYGVNCPRNQGTEGLSVTVDQSKIYGWAAFNVWSDNGTFTIKGSTLTGMNGSYNSDKKYNFSVFVINDDIYDNGWGQADNNTIIIEDSTVAAITKDGQPAETLLRIDVDNTNIEFKGTVTFTDNTNGDAGLVFSISNMENPDAFMERHSNIAEGVTVNCPNGNSLWPANDAYYWWWNEGQKEGVISDFVDVVTSTNGSNLTNGEYIDLRKDVILSDNLHVYLAGSDNKGTVTLALGIYSISGAQLILPEGVAFICDKPLEGVFCAADGCVLSYSEEDDKYRYEALSENEAVASVGTTYFTKLQDAINSDAASNGSPVVLESDTSENVTIDSGKTITMDLNGKTLTLSSTMIVKGNLTVQDSTAKTEPVVSSNYETVSYTAGKILYTGNGTAILPQNGGTFTLLSGIVDASTAGDAIYASGNCAPGELDDETSIFSTINIRGGYVHSCEYGIGVQGRGATANISGGVIVADNNAAVAGNGTNSPTGGYLGGTTINITDGTIIGHIEASGYIACGVYHPQKGTLTISGGTIYADEGLGVLMRGGELKMSGGTILATADERTTGKVGDSNIVVGGSAILFDDKSGYYNHSETDISISGGTLKSAEDVPTVSVNAETAAEDVAKEKIKVSGGSYSSSVAEYVVDSLNYEAYNNDLFTYHTTLNEAMKEVGSGGTVSSVGSVNNDETLTGRRVVFKDGNDTVLEVNVADQEQITLPYLSNNGYYTFAGWSDGANSYKAGDSVKVTANMTFTAQWNYNPPVNPSNPGGGDDNKPEEPAFPFTDVKSTAWYYNAVKYVYENNLMAGTGDTTFDPEVSLTRAMTAQILYNLEGQPKVDEEATFADMNEAPTWSVDAIAWAQDTGVVAGMGDNEFAPNAKVTREQFAQMMYNYAKYKEYDLTKTGDLSKFPDDGSVSDWAETAMSWANGNGLINGHEDSGLIDPAGNTIRGQAASIIMNFDKNVVK